MPWSIRGVPLAGGFALAAPFDRFALVNDLPVAPTDFSDAAHMQERRQETLA